MRDQLHNIGISACFFFFYFEVFFFFFFFELKRKVYLFDDCQCVPNSGSGEKDTKEKWKRKRSLLCKWRDAYYTA